MYPHERSLVKTLADKPFVILGVTTVVFGLTFLSGDPASVLVPLNTSQDEVDRFRHDMGLDRPVPVQYVEFLQRAQPVAAGGVAQLRRPERSRRTSRRRPLEKRRRGSA